MSIPLKCPTCRKRIRQHAIILHSGVIQCDRGTCDTMLYVVPISRLRLVFAVSLSSREAHELRDRQLGLLAVLDCLGARYPEAAA